MLKFELCKENKLCQMSCSRFFRFFFVSGDGFVATLQCSEYFHCCNDYHYPMISVVTLLIYYIYNSRLYT